MGLHKTIKRFGMDGLIKDDSTFPRVREQYEASLIAAMREQGYVPVLTLGPFFSTAYEEEFDRYTFVLSVYGVYVGVRRAQTYEGVDGAGNWYERQDGTVHGETD